jgi:hypothetical protein
LALSCEVRRPFGSRRRDDEKQHVTLPGVEDPKGLSTCYVVGKRELIIDSGTHCCMSCPHRP